MSWKKKRSPHISVIPGYFLQIFFSFSELMSINSEVTGVG